jgi:hypothetical protein
LQLTFFRQLDRSEIMQASEEYFEDVGAILSEAAGVELSFKTKECHRALEELIEEDFTPMFTYICGQVLKEEGTSDENPEEIPETPQGRAEKVIKQVL